MKSGCVWTVSPVHVTGRLTEGRTIDYRASTHQNEYGGEEEGRAVDEEKDRIERQSRSGLSRITGSSSRRGLCERKNRPVGEDQQKRF